MDTKQKQALLLYLKYYTGPVDGEWGTGSMEACRKFQDAEGLTPDAVPGPLTQAAMIDAVKCGRFNKQETKPTQPSAQISQPVQSTGADFWPEIRYFTRAEFRCPCGACGGYPVEPKERLVRFMDTMRGDFNSGVVVVPPDGHSGGSGVRCRAYNATFSNSATNSRHLEGKAADFSAPAVPISKVESYLAAAKAAGKVHYWYRITERAFHVDVD